MQGDGMTASLTIRPFSDANAHHFATINAEWIESMFVLEPHDRHVLDHPREMIVDRGGCILFVAHDEAIIGAGALMPTGDGAYELTKMGVLGSARGLKAGELLLAALIAEAETRPDCQLLYLLTNHICEAAIHLYEKAGFRHDPAIMARFGTTYARCDVAMRYPLAVR